MDDFTGTIEEAGVLVRKLRKVNGWNQTELADRAGFSRKDVSDIELGRSRNDMSKALILLTVVGVKVRFFETHRSTEAVQIDLRKHLKEYTARSLLPLSERD